MNQTELIRLLAEKSGRTQPDVKAMLEALAAAVTEAGPDGVKVPGLGKFVVKVRPARQGRNPRTGESVEIAERRFVKFTPGKTLTDAVQG